MTTTYSDIVGSQELSEFASFEGIEIAGTHDHGVESEFANWLEGIDLHADVDMQANAIDAHIGNEISELSGADFSKLSEQQLGRLVREALADIKFDGSEITAGSPVQALASNFADKGGPSGPTPG